MQATILTQKTALHDSKMAAMKAFWAKRGEDYNLSNDEKQEITKLNTEATELATEITELKEFKEAYEKAEALQKLIHAPLGSPDLPGGDPRTQIKRENPETLARQFVNDPKFKAWLQTVAPDGAEPAPGIRLSDSPRVEAKSLVYSSLSTAGGALIRRDYGPWPVELPMRPISILDVVTHIPTGSNLIEFVRVNTLTRAAAFTPEATATSGGGYTAALKPEAGMSLQTVQTSVQTMPVWIPVTRNVLADAPQLEGLIENFLRRDCQLALEDEIITGTGASGHFTGLDNTAGLTPQPYDAGGTPLLTITRKALTKVKTIGRATPTAFLLNPYDWETMSLLTAGTTGAFYFGGPQQFGIPTLWGLPVITSECVPQGTGYVGDMNQLVVWDREQTTIRMTDSHSDFFTHNVLVVLAELRAAFAVLRPAAIVKMDFVLGPNS